MKLLVNEALESLKNLRTQVKPGDFDQLFDEIEKQIGVCDICYGRGFVLFGNIQSPGYKLRKTFDGRPVYQYPCKTCNGTGQFLEKVPCVSCGTLFFYEAFRYLDINTTDLSLPSQQLCPSCLSGQIRRFGLVPEGSPPTLAKVDNDKEKKQKDKIDRAHKEADEEVHDPEKEHPKRKKR